jgi:hypothetical protein
LTKGNYITTSNSKLSNTTLINISSIDSIGKKSMGEKSSNKTITMANQPMKSHIRHQRVRSNGSTENLTPAIIYQSISSKKSDETLTKSTQPKSAVSIKGTKGHV